MHKNSDILSRAKSLSSISSDEDYLRAYSACVDLQRAIAGIEKEFVERNSVIKNILSEREVARVAEVFPLENALRSLIANMKRYAFGRICSYGSNTVGKEGKTIVERAEIRAFFEELAKKTLTLVKKGELADMLNHIPTVYNDTFGNHGEFVSFCRKWAHAHATEQLLRVAEASSICDAKGIRSPQVYRETLAEVAKKRNSWNSDWETRYALALIEELAVNLGGDSAIDIQSVANDAIKDFGGVIWAYANRDIVLIRHKKGSDKSVAMAQPLKGASPIVVWSIEDKAKIPLKYLTVDADAVEEWIKSNSGVAMACAERGEKSPIAGLAFSLGAEINIEDKV